MFVEEFFSFGGWIASQLQELAKSINIFFILTLILATKNEQKSGTRFLLLAARRLQLQYREQMRSRLLL